MLSDAEITIYRNEFQSLTNESGGIEVKKIPNVLDRLLKRPATSLEKRVFMNALPRGADTVTFDTFMEQGMGLTNPKGWRNSTTAAPAKEAAPKAAPVPQSAEPVAILSDEQKGRIVILHNTFDRLGDNNGTVEKHELEAVDKKGKLFNKLDSTSSGHVTVEGFTAYFSSLIAERGPKAVEGLICHMEKYLSKISKGQARDSALKQVVEEKSSAWSAELQALSPEELGRAAALHKAFDELGDNNGTVEKEELEAVDKRGKLFDKLDTSSSGHVTVEAFQAFFGKMKTERGEQAPSKLMSHMEKFVETGKERQASVKSFEEEKKSQWEASAANLSTDQRNRVRLIFMAVDNGGDGNGTVEKAELEFLDKKGKMFDKIDSSSTGHVTSEAFEAYFGEMQVSRGDKAVDGFLTHLERTTASVE